MSNCCSWPVLGLLVLIKVCSPCANYVEYPGSGFFVANFLANWKKLESNEIDFCQGFSQKVVSTSCSVFKSMPASGDFRHLLITFANSLDPDQAGQNVGPGLDPNCLIP